MHSRSAVRDLVFARAVDLVAEATVVDLLAFLAPKRLAHGSARAHGPRRLEPDVIGYHLREDPDIADSPYDADQLRAWLTFWAMQQLNLYVFPRAKSNLSSCAESLVFLPVEHPTQERALARLILLSLAVCDTDENARGLLLGSELLMTRRLWEAVKSLGVGAYTRAPFESRDEIVHAVMVAFHGRIAARPFLGRARADWAARLLVRAWFGVPGERPDLGRRLFNDATPDHLDDPNRRAAGAEKRALIVEAALSEIADAATVDYLRFLTAARLAAGQPFRREAVGQQFTRLGSQRAFSVEALVDHMLTRIAPRTRAAQAEPFDMAGIDEGDVHTAYEEWLVRPIVPGGLGDREIETMWKLDLLLLAGDQATEGISFDTRRQLDDAFDDPLAAAQFVAFQGHVLVRRYGETGCSFADLRTSLLKGWKDP